MSTSGMESDSGEVRIAPPAVICTVCGTHLANPFHDTGDEILNEMIYQLWLETPCPGCRTKPEEMGWE